jgi:hypothetical protein
MRKIFILVLILASALRFLSIAEAEGGCPPGQYPQQGQGWQTCVPIPGASTQAPTQANAPAPPVQQWRARWGAIAADGVQGILGSVDNAATRADAERYAMADCAKKGGNPCKIGTSYRNGCGAMSVGATGFAIASGPDENEAVAASMKECTSGRDTECHKYYVGCTRPELID